MYEGLPTNMPLALVDLDNSITSRNIARQLEAFEGSEIVYTTNSFSDAREELQKGNVYGIMLIPSDFERDASLSKQPQLSFYTNNSFLIAGSLLFKDLKTIATLSSAAVNLKIGRAKGQSDKELMPQIQPIGLDTHPIGNPWINYSVYLSNMLLPGILQLMILLVTVYSIGIEMKEKTARKWLQMGNSSLIRSLFGKLLPQTGIFFIVGMILFIAMYIILEFPLNGNFLNMMLGMLLAILSAQALGIFMIGVLPTLRLGLSFASIWGMLSFSISGFSFPVTAMYSWVKALSILFPLRHYYLIYVDQALNGRDMIYSWHHYLALAAFIILPFTILKNLKAAIRHLEYKP
ncbi:membrane protein [Bacteroidales bacterium]|nr:membrane protein [Bacteroidales bacterium]